MMSILSRLVSMGLLSLLGLGALATLIWYIGPLFSFGDSTPLASATSRIVFIISIFGVWFIYRLIRWLVERKKNRQMEAELAEPADPNAEQSDEEIATLKGRFDEAIKTLKKSGKGGKAKSLYQLPWYMIIGPPGSGKTTLLVNSGLRFPLAERMGQSKVQGIGGTRYCDWWFTDEAVMIDTAGRYTTQDSNRDVDNASWLGFLKLLKKNRARRPINGIIVAISTEELIRQSERDRERTATAVTERIQELYEKLGVRFPVYLMFTKCDLLAGFMEYFGDLDRSEREQVWGFTYDVDENPLEAFGGEFDQLQEQLETRLVSRLQAERDPQRRDLIYNFPQQFNSTRALLDEFINRVFKPSRYMANPFLRGVYFTSGTQEGTPFNRIMGQLARDFGLSRTATQTQHQKGKSFFIHDLLDKVIFGESGLAGSNLKVERLYGLLRKAAYGAMVAVPLLIIAAWIMSYFNNTGYIDDAEAAATVLEDTVEDTSSRNVSVLGVLPALNEARALPGGYAELEDGIPMSREFGLDQSGKLGERGAVLTYRRILEKGFLPRIMVRLEQQMSDAMNKPETLYQSLKVYLMLGLPERMDTDMVKAWIVDDWEREMSRVATTEQLDQLKLHLDALLEAEPLVLPFDQDRNLIMRARAQLSQTTVAERIYTQIKSRHMDEGQAFTVVNGAGPDGPTVFQRRSGEGLSTGVPALFSPAGYTQMFLPSQGELVDEMEDEAWIFATEAADAGTTDTDQLSASILNLYVRDYIDTWNAFLGDIGIRPFRDLPQAATILGILSGEDSPLRLLLTNAADQTRLTSGGDGEGDPSFGERVQGMFRRESNLDPSAIDEAFADLHRMVTAPEGRASQLDNLFEDLNELFIFVNSMTKQSNKNMLSDLQGDVDAALVRIRSSAQRTPAPVSEWVLGLASATNDLVAGGAMAAINSAWSTDVAPFCRQAIAGRYPFSPDAQGEVALQDFGTFFGPGGTLDTFFQEYLIQVVDTNARTWRVNPNIADSITLDGGALRQLQRAKEIQRAFFMGGGRQPSVSFSLRPQRMDATTTNFTLMLDGQRATYDHGPITNQNFRWPGETGISEIRYQFVPPTARGQSGATLVGPWAWFRLLDDANLEETNIAEVFQATFRLDDRFITYEIRANSAFNPFNLDQLRAFRCPDRL